MIASALTITMSPDGNRAIMRFRKQYVIAGPKVNRSSGDRLDSYPDNGWRIDAEQDVTVLRKRSPRLTGTLSAVGVYAGWV